MDLVHFEQAFWGTFSQAATPLRTAEIAQRLGVTTGEAQSHLLSIEGKRHLRQVPTADGRGAWQIVAPPARTGVLPFAQGSAAPGLGAPPAAGWVSAARGPIPMPSPEQLAKERSRARAKRNGTLLAVGLGTGAVATIVYFAFGTPIWPGLVLVVALALLVPPWYASH